MSVRGASLVLASFAVHAAVAALVRSVRVETPRPPTPVTIREAKRAPEPPKPPEAPPPSNDRAAPQSRSKAPPTTPKSTPVSATKTAPQSASSDVPDLGLLGGDSGPGLAIPQGAGASETAAVKPPPKSEAPRAQKPQDSGCDEPAQKPKVERLPQPAYTDSARDGGIQGRVRVEIQVDERGGVAGVSLLQGLGHGLDQAALEAAKRAVFKPATRCGKPVAASFVVSLRFTL